MAVIKDAEKHNYRRALGLAQSLRGQFIIGQALHYAIIALEKVDRPHRETSNIEDMKLLRASLFPMFSASVEATENFKKNK